MNTIFERIVEIELDLHNLIQDVSVGVEACPNNREEISEKLMSASVSISHVYKLNKANFNEEAETS